MRGVMLEWGAQSVGNMYPVVFSGLRKLTDPFNFEMFQAYTCVACFFVLGQSKLMLIQLVSTDYDTIICNVYQSTFPGVEPPY